MSGASRLSKPSVAEIRGTRPVDAASVRPSQVDTQSMTTSVAKSQAYSELDEDDEWNAIMKFNTLLHYEEQKQSLLRDKERKRLIREELDNQMKEKKVRISNDMKEDRMYENL